MRTCKVKCFGSVGGLRHVEAREKMFFSRTFNEVVLGFLPEKGTPELHVKTRESLWLIPRCVIPTNTGDFVFWQGKYSNFGKHSINTAKTRLQTGCTGSRPDVATTGAVLDEYGWCASFPFDQKPAKPRTGFQIHCGPPQD